VDAGGRARAEIRLATMDLPSSLVAVLVRSPETARARGSSVGSEAGRSLRARAAAGRGGADVLTVGVGPAPG